MKIKKITVAIVLAIFVASMLVSCAQAERPLSAAELLNLGERYLLELNFEQALVQFSRLIEIEPMNPRGYTGAAEAYIGLGRADDAVAVLRLGYERTGDSSIQQMLDAISLAEVIDEAATEPEIDYEEQVGLTDEQLERFLTEAIPLLNELANLVFAGNDEAIFGMIESGELRQIFSTFPDEVFPLFADINHGRIGIYQGDGRWRSGYFVYIGEYFDDSREGFGTWLLLSNAPSISEGEWRNDMPNGHFNVRSRMFYNETGTIHTSSGNIVDGLWHGESTGSHPLQENIFVYSYNMGLVTVLEVGENGPVVSRCIVDNRPMVFLSEWVNQTNGIAGFSERSF